MKNKKENQVYHGLLYFDTGNVFVNKEHQWLPQPFLVKCSD